MRQQYRKEFGFCLRELRKGIQKSQEELAELLNVSRITIVNTEKGQSIPKTEFIEKAYHLFQSEDLVLKYTLIQQDKKELSLLAGRIHQVNCSLGVRITKMIIRESLSQGDLHGVVTSLFQLILWDIAAKGKTSGRKINWVIQAFEALDPEPNGFLEILDELYHLSKKPKNYDAFLTITEAISKKMTLDSRRHSQLLYQEATAYYIKGWHDKAYKLSTKAIEVMGGEVFQHTAHTFHRHSLICMQLCFYGEALEHALSCLQMVPETSDLYKLVKQGLARMYYMNEQFGEAKALWDELFKTMSRNEIKKIHSLNDIIFMEIKLGQLNKARESIHECERLLQLAQKAEWSFYQAEVLLLKRNIVMFTAVQTGDFLHTDVSMMLAELKESYLKDEFELTKNFVLERAFLSGRMDPSRK